MNRRTIEGTILKKMNPKVISSILDLKQQKSSEFVIASGSMHPSLKIGEKVTFRDIKPSDERKFRVGDVVVFEDSGRRIAHRLVRVKGDIIVTKGITFRIAISRFLFRILSGLWRGSLPKRLFSTSSFATRFERLS